ncbi:hypothetical protein OF83DRAFT_1108230 [Amylostereum chailletii]|nr:hypothetical protein OF83DRAFT_1108230 [Amylostereum chailletii]
MSRASTDAAYNTDASKDAQGNSLYAALARTLTRSVALYFSRPVRLFRPAKISGWNSLRSLAQQKGVSLSPKFMSQLVKKHGWIILPKHFIPPLAVNAFLGTVLWTTYAETSAALNDRLGDSPITLAAIAGGAAGGMQAIVAAPAENVRLAIEGGSLKEGGWSHAWKEVFRGTVPRSSNTAASMEDIRQVRDWMRDVRDMAGRGWDGWGWTFAKDVCGFAMFFSIFEGTRSVAAQAKTLCQSYILDNRPREEGKPSSARRHAPRLVHGLVLVSGGAFAGLAYEVLSRPWDVARRLVYLDRVNSTVHHTSRHILFGIVARKVREDGLLSLFHAPGPVHHDPPSVSPGRRRLNTALRTLGRVGPWGIGFLVWEAFGPGLS